MRSEALLDAIRSVPPSPLRFGAADAMMICVALIWGGSFTVVKHTVLEFSPMVFNAVRTTLAAVILLAALWVRGERLRDAGGDWLALAWMGAFGYFGYQLFFVLGLARTTASNSSILVATVPVFVSALNGILRVEQVSPRVWLGVLASFAGIVLIVLGGRADFTLGGPALLGDAFSLAAALAWACFVVYSRPHLERRSALLVTTWAVCTASLCLWLAAVPSLAEVHWSGLSLSSWLAVAYSGGLAVSGAYLLWNMAVQRVGGTRVAVYSNLSTVVAIIVAAVALGEAITALKVAGAASVFGGIVLARRGAARSKP